RRLSFRRLAGMRPAEPTAEVVAVPAPRADDSRGHGRRRGRRGGRGRPHHAPVPMPQPPPSLPHATVASNGEPAIEPHTAPHDEIVNVIHELLARAHDSSISIDTLANALKSRGFRRPPGSPRLITRLRRIREITIDRSGRITLLDGGPAVEPAAPRLEAPEPVVQREPE